MARYVIWHNPRCSKSRQTLELLQSHGVEPEVVKYLERAPTRAELDRTLRLLALEPRDLMRKREAPYAELGLDDPSLGRDALIDAMVAHPILIERPVVIRDGARAALGRPPEQVLALLDE
ncbi:MAG: arsenate reductase (glutaredoxin) [Myxococcales bacterium]|nr:arsenate reductase (glutaredoxin) [Myxococcales bacterium]